MKPSLLFTLLLCAILPAAAQNNPYSIDDDCYKLFLETERLLGTPQFEAVNQTFLATALQKGDKKAETLYYVESLKHLTRLARSSVTSTPEQDRQIEEAQEILKGIAKRNGYMQYYYYSYDLVQTHYYNHNKFIRVQELVQQMQEKAIAEHDDFGTWSAYRYLAALYISLFDYGSAKKYINAALDLYNSSTDETLRRQSATRLYCDLSDAYPIGADSVRINIAKAVESAKEPMDSLRCEYHLAKLDAFYYNLKDYRRHRDNCLQNTMLPQISRSAPEMFAMIDKIVAKDFDMDDAVKASQITRIREVKYIANIAEEYGFKDEAFYIEKELVKRLERYLSESNASKLTEMDARLGNNELSVEVAEKSRTLTRISRIAMTLTLLILLGGVTFLIYQIRSLQRRRKRDEQVIRELQEANERVRLADEAKTRFVQNMSHEVRTPLNAIVGFSQLLSLPDGSFPPEEKDEFAGHIINNSKMLTMLLDDILNASAMDSGKYRITYEDGEMHFMAQAAISSAEHRLQPGVRMYYVPCREEPFHFTTDPRRVQQILINLLTNACKHTAKGEIRLESSLSENQGFVTYSVTDTGPGVPPDQADKIFERFAKLNEFVQGTGLGLSICRDIADRMGAKVFLDTSYTAGGARFVFAVPIEPPKEQNQA